MLCTPPSSDLQAPVTLEAAAHAVSAYRWRWTGEARAVENGVEASIGAGAAGAELLSPRWDLLGSHRAAPCNNVCSKPLATIAKHWPGTLGADRSHAAPHAHGAAASAWSCREVCSAAHGPCGLPPRLRIFEFHLQHTHRSKSLTRLAALIRRPPRATGPRECWGHGDG